MPATSTTAPTKDWRTPGMRPFEVSPALESLRETYPSADALLEAARNGNRDARHAIARLWLSEGIPFAFRTRPGIYESIRAWLARRLEVQAKEITLIGSGRQGISLSPDANLGRPFGDHSDLDLTIISASLFQRLRTAFERWVKDYSEGVVTPRHVRERGLWDANKQSGPSWLSRGFIDPNKIPTRERYPEAQDTLDTMYRLGEKLKSTPDTPAVLKVSVRVYRDWDAFTEQMATNLWDVARFAARRQA